MRYFIAITIIILFNISCANNEFANLDNPYQISSKKAKNMIKYKKDCSGSGCKEGTIFNKREDVFNALKTIYPNATVEWVDARYRPKDEKHYCQINNCSEGDPSSKVSGYSTQIVQVTFTSKEMAPLYFDLVSICPPPESATNPGQCALTKDTTESPTDTLSN